MTPRPTINNIISKSIGVRITLQPGTEKVLNLFLKDSELPVKKSLSFGTVEENQAEMEFELYENLSTETIVELYESKCIDEVKITLPRLPKDAKINVEFEYGEDGFQIHATHSIELPVSFSKKLREERPIVINPAQEPKTMDNCSNYSNQIYGIDFGTTYSRIAMMDEFCKAVVIKNCNGEEATPSVVYYESENQVVVGYVAKEMMMTEPERCVACIKREIGNSWYESKCIYPEDPAVVTAYILKKMVQDANDVTMQEIKDVVIAYPAHFGVNEKLQLNRACEIAGLNLVSAINEITAIALAYRLTDKEDQAALIYDLGGATFDVTIIKTNEDTIRIVTTSGDNHLGGNDWDRAIVDYLAAKFEEDTDLSGILDDHGTEVYLCQQAERAKRRLSFTMHSTHKVSVRDQVASIEISRDIFHELTQHLLERTMIITCDTFEIAKTKGVLSLDKILLAGGASKMPQVKDRLQQEFPNIPVELFEPDEAVAKGAAIYAINPLKEKERKIVIH